MVFRLAGMRFDLAASDVRERMQGVESESIRVHGVKLNGTIYPVKQVISTAFRISKADFNSFQARSILQRLGFEVTE